MEIAIDKDTLIFFHDILIDFYRETRDPITLGQSESIADMCAEKPFIDIYNFIPFPHILHKATVLMEAIIRMHPFVDGNKRVALLSAFYFLYWNGYDLAIPENAPLFTIEIAEGKRNLNDILTWLSHNSTRNLRTVLRSILLSLFLTASEELKFGTITGAILTPMFFTAYPFMFFRYLIAKKAKQENPRKPSQTR